MSKKRSDRSENIDGLRNLIFQPSDVDGTVSEFHPLRSRMIFHRNCFQHFLIHDPLRHVHLLQRFSKHILLLVSALCEDTFKMRYAI